MRKLCAALEKAGASAVAAAIARLPNCGDVTPIDLSVVSEYLDLPVKDGAVSFKR